MVWKSSIADEDEKDHLQEQIDLGEGERMIATVPPFPFYPSIPFHTFMCIVIVGGICVVYHCCCL